MYFCIEIYGLVQGVGFRPFIYNLALKHSLKGYVTNNGDGVYIELNTTYKKLYKFMEQIQLKKPPLSKIEYYSITSKDDIKKFKNFTIKESEESFSISTMIPSDIAMCKECEIELNDKNNRRYQYPFITCTNCGPRYSIIKNLPYDRCNTSMDKFKMCDKCKVEYTNPKDRRYHAQPIGCFDCGLELSLYDKEKNKLEINSKNYIDDIVTHIKSGKIVAIKGIGGYHIFCDASNDKSIKLLRERKNRPSKPFAIMAKNLTMAKNIVTLNTKEEELLSSPKRPIVLAKQKDKNNISNLIAPNINQLGILLPYTPIHTLILDKLNKPVVATSANISGEPLCKTFDEIMNISHIWDYCLDNNRDIINSCDDSIAFVEENTTFMLRVARGYTPNYLKLPKNTDKKILCLGANQKSTISIVIKDKVILSPYIADLNSLETINRFKAQIDRFKKIYNFEPEIIVCDKHPSYESTKYAKELTKQNPNIKLIQVQHHYAHILATMGINNIRSKVLGVSFDGTGYGDDNNLWGGEFLICDYKGYKRVNHFNYFKLLGGTLAIKEPRRVALSFLFDIYGKDTLDMNNNTINSFSKGELKTFYTLWEKNINSPLTSSCGRLFDLVASLLNIVQISSYEGESGLLLESYYDSSITDYFEFDINNKIIDFKYIVIQILKEQNHFIAVSKFFNTLVEIIYEMGKKYKLPIVLGGGVFQNRVIIKLLIEKIPNIILPKEFISNDSSIAYGQAIASI